MSLSARECRERAMEARGLARSARTMAAWTACEQVADYWLVLAERVEHDQPHGIRVAPSPSSSRTIYPDTMPILGYGAPSLSSSLSSSLSKAPATASLLPARSGASGPSDWR
jgi:hypothetical protein